MYKFINIRHDIIEQCYGNNKEMKKFKYKLEIEIYRNSTQKICVSWGVLFKDLGVQKGTQTPCWLRSWHNLHPQPILVEPMIGVLLKDFWSLQKYTKKLKNDWNPGKWVYFELELIQWIPSWQGLSVFQKYFTPWQWVPIRWMVTTVKEPTETQVANSFDTWLSSNRIWVSSREV